MNRIELARYRLENAHSRLIESRDNIAIGHFRISVYSSYYAILSAIRALLLLKDENPKTHEGAIKLFNKYFVKDKKFPYGVNKLIKEAKELREESDYGDFFIVDKKSAEEHLQRAEQFVKRAEEVLTDVLLKENKL